MGEIDLIAVTVVDVSTSAIHHVDVMLGCRRWGEGAGEEISARGGPQRRDRCIGIAAEPPATAEAIEGDDPVAAVEFGDRPRGDIGKSGLAQGGLHRRFENAAEFI